MKTGNIKNGHLYLVTSKIHGHGFKIGSVIEAAENEDKDSGAKCIIRYNDGATVDYWWLRCTEVFEIGQI